MPDFDINTDRSLWELDRLAASGLQNDEVSRRVENAIGDSDRAAWLVRAWRRRQVLGRLRKVGYWVAGLAIAAGVVACTLAANDSSFAPSFIAVVGTSLIGEVAGGVVMLAAILRASGPMEIPVVDRVPAILAKSPRRASSSHHIREMSLNFAIGMVVILVVFELLVVYPRVRLGAALRERGAETTGTITNKHVTIGSSGTPFYSMDFEFAVPGTRTIHGHAVLERAEYERVAIGKPTPVTYLGRDPVMCAPFRRSELTTAHALSRRQPPLQLLGLAVILMPALALLLRNVMAKMLATLRDGVATLAEVTEVSRARIAFVFVTGPGVIQNGAVPIMRKKVRRLPVKGERIVAIYDPAGPSRVFVVALVPGVRFE